MELVVGAKSTKPGSKAKSRNPKSGGRSERVPAGTIHVIDLDEQSALSASHTAVCGEGALVRIDASWDDEFDNERCEACNEQMWAKSFTEMQATLLK